MSEKQLVDNARMSLNDFCFKECKAYCCRKGFLLLTKKETELITNKKLIFLLKNDMIKKVNNKFSLQINPCASLKNDKCVIYKNEDRPAVCKEFPIFIWKNKVIHLSNRCLFINQGLLYPHIAKFKSEGYKLSYEN